MALVDLVMPKLGESIMEAIILKWTKQIGDNVRMDETVLEIATDKVDSEVPSTVNGVLSQILFQENDVVPVGTVVARIETNGIKGKDDDDIQVMAEKNDPVEPFTHEEKIEEPTNEQPEEQIVPYVPKQVNIPQAAGSNKFYSPLVINIANSEGISMSDLEKIPGTGNDGRVTKKDILQFVAGREEQPAEVETTIVEAPVPIKAEEPLVPTRPEHQPVAQPGPIVQPAPAPQPQSQTKPEPQSQPQQQPEAKAQPELPSQPKPLSEPQVPSSEPVTVQEKPAAEPVREPETGYTPSAGNVVIVEMDRMRKMIAKHMVSSKQTSPHVTSFSEADVTNLVLWRERVKQEFEKSENTKLTYTPLFLSCIARVIKRYPYINCSVDGDRIILKKDINIGMATALPSGSLIVPVIKNADYLNLVGLSKSVNSLADNARNSRLKPDDTAGGTFTFTNVGTFGSLMGTPIINQPQVAILAVGAIKKRPVVIESPEGDAIGIRHMMYLSLSYDHRVVDGSVGASFLTEVAKELENWDLKKEW